MASLPPEEQVRFLLACLKNTEPPDFAAVAVDSGLPHRKNARFRYKSLVEAHDYVIDGENKIELKAGIAPPATPKNIASGAPNGDEATPAETPSTSSPTKRGRPKKNAADGDQVETPAKKPRKSRAKKEKQTDDTNGAEEVVPTQVDVSNIGDGSNSNVDEIGLHTNGSVDED